MHNELKSCRQNWVVYTKEGCPYCRNAIDYLKSKKKNIVTKDGEKFSKEVNIIMKSLNKQDFKTWPKIIRPGCKFVGGYNDLKNLTDI